MENTACIYCNASFAPNKYSPRQKVCSNPECQKKRQLESMRNWRKKNPNYFKYDESKGLEWLQTQRRRSKLWRDKNPEKVRSYRQAHSDEYRSYMREYMRQYRQRRRDGGASTATAMPGPDSPASP